MATMRIPLGRFTSFLTLLVAFAATTGCGPEAKRARHLQRAEAYFQSGDYDRAEIEYANAQKLADRKLDVGIARRLARMYQEQGRFVATAVAVDKARAIFPDDFDLRLTSAKLLVDSLRLPSARAMLVELIKEAPAHREIPLLLASCATTPDEVADIRGRLTAMSKQVGERAELHVAFGFLKIKEKDLPAAEAAFHQALALDPKSSDAYSGLGRVCWAKEDKERANQFFLRAAELAPIRSGKRLQHAMFKVQTGAREEAKAMLQAITREAPDYLPAWRSLAEMAIAEGRLEDCQSAVRTILSRDQYDFTGVSLKARMDLMKGLAANAIESLTVLTKIYTNSTRALFELAVVQSASGSAGQAVETLQRVLRMDTNHVDSRLLMARLLVRQGKVAQATTLLTDLCLLSPPIQDAFTLLASAYLAQQKPHLALEACRRFLASAPQSPEPRFQEGLILMGLGRWTEAQTALEECLRLTPQNLYVLEQLVDIDLRNRDPERALFRTQTLSASGTNLAGALLLQARVHLSQTNLTQAESVLIQALKLDPTARGAFVMLADIYVQTKRHTEALAKLEAVVSGKPNDWETWTRIAAIQTRVADFGAAAKAWENVLKSSPRNAVAMNELAILYSGTLKKLEQAYKLAAEARQLLPLSPQIADTLGWILCHRGEYARSIPLLSESAEKLPRSSEVQFHLGMAHYMMVEEPLALAALERAINLPADFAGKQGAVLRLKLLRSNPEQTATELIETCQRQTSDLPGNPPGDPIALLRQGIQFEMSGFPEKAKSAYERAILATVKSPVPKLKLASVLARKLKDPGRAFELARSALELDPTDALVSRQAGAVALGIGEYKWAAGALRESLRSMPGQPDVLIELARARYATGQVKEALDHLDQAMLVSKDSPQLAAQAALMRDLVRLAADPVGAESAAARVQDLLSVDPENVPALIVAGGIYERRGNLTDAKAAVEQALKIHPDFGPGLKQLAILYARTPADLKSAYELAVRARKALPEDSEVSGLLGRLLYDRGDFNSAIPLLREAHRSKAEDINTLYYLGLAQAKALLKLEAQNTLDRALRLAPAHPLAPEAKSLLKLQK